MSMQTTMANEIDFGEVKLRQQQVWGDGDYAQIGVTLQTVGERLAESLDIQPGEGVLDVAAGNGNFTLAAARCLADVTSTDYVEDLLMRGKVRAAAEGFGVRFQTADAEDLPFPDAAFDVVGSTFGVMFTPDQERAASEMARVCRPGGRIGLANWTPEGFIGQLFRTVGRHVAPPAGVPSAALWGTCDHIGSLFAERAREITIREREFVFRDHTPAMWVDRFRRVYGPVKRAFDTLDAVGTAALERDMLDLIAAFNTVEGGAMRIPGAYLEVVIERA